MSAPTTMDLLLVRAALHVGATPAEALCAMPVDVQPPLQAVVAGLRAGESLAERGGRPDATVLERALATAEITGSAATPAIDALLDAVAADHQLRGLVEARSAQARLTARLLIVLPLVGAVLISLADPGARGFLVSPGGLVVILLAAVLMAVAARWMRHLSAAVDRAVLAVDPLVGDRDRLGATRFRRPRPRMRARGRAGEHAGSGLPTAEGLELLALALSAGVPLVGAVTVLGQLAPPAVRPVFHAAARSLQAGRSVAEAFPPELSEVTTLIGLTAHFGAPAAPSLRLLAADLRTRARFAAETAAEQLAVRLVFPTTLLLVPAFGLLVVAPLLASAFAGFQLGR